MKIGLYHKLCKSNPSKYIFVWSYLYEYLANIRPDEDVVKQIALDLPRTSRWLVSENSGLASSLFIKMFFVGTHDNQTTNETIISSVQRATKKSFMGICKL